MPKQEEEIIGVEEPEVVTTVAEEYDVEDDEEHTWTLVTSGRLFEEGEVDTVDLEFLQKRRYSVIEYKDNETGETLKVIRFKHTQQLPVDLPAGFGFKGGVARNVVLSELGDRVLPPRDIDIVAISDQSPDVSKSKELEQKYMAYDAKHGYGVETESLAHYLETRDFGMNEVAVVGEDVYMTLDALSDLRNKIIWPTNFEKETWYDKKRDERGGIGPKLVMKSLRLYSEMCCMYGKSEIKGVGDWQFDSREIPFFHIALQLDKAFENGDTVAVAFFRALLLKGIVVQSELAPPGSLRADSSVELAIRLRYRLDNFTFRSKPELTGPLDYYYSYLAHFKDSDSKIFS